MNETAQPAPQALPALPLEVQAQLDKLPDIHTPDAIAWWPLAWGWWCVLALCVFVLIVGVWRHYRYRVYRAAIAELMAIPLSDSATLARELSTLLKRVALYRQRDVAALNGQAWATYLLTALPNGGFQPQQAQFIALASYEKTPTAVSDDEWQALQHSAKRWIRAQFQQPAGGDA